MKKAYSSTIMALLSCTLLSSFFILPVFSQSPELLEPRTIPKWVNQLDGPPPIFVPENILDNDGKIMR
jgi:hypothetical protein